MKVETARSTAQVSNDVDTLPSASRIDVAGEAGERAQLVKATPLASTVSRNVTASVLPAGVLRTASQWGAEKRTGLRVRINEAANKALVIPNRATFMDYKETLFYKQSDYVNFRYDVQQEVEHDDADVDVDVNVNVNVNVNVKSDIKSVVQTAQSVGHERLQATNGGLQGRDEESALISEALNDISLDEQEDLPFALFVAQPFDMDFY